MDFVLAIVGLLLLVLIHEAGHFVAAKAVGMRATKFYVGFPPALAKLRRGDTEYGLGAIPLGGYVRIVGMARPRPQDLRSFEEAVRQVARAHPGDAPELLAPALARAQAALNREDAAPDLLPALADLQDALDATRPYLDEERLQWCQKELTRVREDADPKAYWRQPVWRRLVAIIAGPAANVLTAFVILAAYFMIGSPRLEPFVQSIIKGSPAASAGLHPNDQIVAANGVRTTDPNRLRTVIQQGRPVTLTVRRGGHTVTLPAATPRQVPGCGRCLGFGFGFREHGTRHEGPISAVGSAWGDISYTTRATFTALADVVTGGDRQQLSSAVGIVQASQTSVHQGVYPRLLALISLSLALFNILPFLPLDGGHVLFSLIELVRRRPVRREVYERVSALGIAAMLMLFFVGLSNDIGRLTGPHP